MSSSVRHPSRRPGRSWSSRNVGHALAIGLALGGLWSIQAMAQGATPETDCDRMAQPPRQTMGKLPALSEGVSYASLRGAAAREACARAMAEHPEDVRFIVYAARAADKAGDPREAVRLYRLGVDKGSALAQNNLGTMYEAGEGALPRNEREAQRLYRLAADQGLPGAQSNLGTMYASGHGGLRRDDQEAVRLWMLAAESEDSQAQNNLGKMYAEGRGGLRRDSQEAARMWRLAAAQGSVEATNNLRKMGVR